MYQEQRKKQVLTEETIELPRRTIAGLLEAIKQAFAIKTPRVHRFRWTRGAEHLIVERFRPESEDTQDEFLSPYQMIRQYAQLEIMERKDEPLEMVAEAVQQLTIDGFKVTMLVCPSKEALRRAFHKSLRIDQVWQVPLYEDPDIDHEGVFVVGSTRGDMLRDIEAAVFCKMEL